MSTVHWTGARGGRGDIPLQGGSGQRTKPRVGCEKKVTDHSTLPEPHTTPHASPAAGAAPLRSQAAEGTRYALKQPHLATSAQQCNSFSVCALLALYHVSFSQHCLLASNHPSVQAPSVCAGGRRAPGKAPIVISSESSVRPINDDYWNYPRERSPPLQTLLLPADTIQLPHHQDPGACCEYCDESFAAQPPG